jgi:hypothetical protein
LAKRTVEYERGEITEDAWIKNPGLEPIMREWFEELNIIPRNLLE